jgi:hypothetical protein
MRRFAILAVAILVTLATQGGVAAAKSEQTFGPYTVVSTDSGTCGVTDWATDTFTRRFIVKANGDGTYSMRVTNTHGTFVTMASASPGACEAGGEHGATISAGVTGKMHGTFDGTVSGGTLNPNAICPPTGCFLSVFTTLFFGTGATFSCVSGVGTCRFKFQYSSDEKGLLYRHWTNANKANGDTANKGDIADH